MCTCVTTFQLERRRLKTVSGELERAFEEVRTRTEDNEERWREAESMKSVALAASKSAIKEKEAVQLRSVQVEEAARRLEAERTSTAQVGVKPQLDCIRYQAFCQTIPYPFVLIYV